MPASPVKQRCTTAFSVPILQVYRRSHDLMREVDLKEQGR